jgi:transketolase
VSSFAHLDIVAKTIRGLSIDAIEAANSGHPGLPMGCAEIMAYLYGHGLDLSPRDTSWMNRDRFVLSAGHGSMALYSSLHLAGFDLSLDDIKAFRQLHSPTAGHPEYGECPGVEMTTGPLGQGVATAAGMALGQKLAANRYGVQDLDLLNGRVVVLAGDGCIMEGISAESASLAGHLKLDNLTLIYDANDICLDGPLSECMTEDTAKRYESYGWDVQTINGHDYAAIDKAYQAAGESNTPSLIIAKTTIGFGSPNRAGSSEAHGKALGAEEMKLTKEALGIPLTPLFHVPEEVTSFFQNRQSDWETTIQSWKSRYQEWATDHPEAAAAWQSAEAGALSADLIGKVDATETKPNGATRQSSSAVLQTLHDAIPNVVGGSADLSCSDNTWMKAGGQVGPGDFSGRNIKYGVREFAMAAMASGLALHGLHRPYCGTFMMFSDYMRNAIRLAALMKLPVLYQFTHDSVFLGEDGPTHQPVEHLASLRAMPGLTVLRPADATEVKGSWLAGLTGTGPAAIVLSRQGLPDLPNSDSGSVAKGGYVIQSEARTDALDLTILATGSEVSLACNVASQLEQDGKSVRVVSLPSFELFESQSNSYRDTVLGEPRQFVSIEAQTTFGWHRYIGRDGLAIGIDTFGASAPASDLAELYQFTPQAILSRIREFSQQTVSAPS